jgi:zona occludens toxin
MAIELLTGVPGGGKSYFAVHKIHKLLQKEGKFLVLHNIEGLKIPDNRLISKDWVLHDFENDTMAAYLGSLRQEYGMSSEDKVFIFVDEAQRFFPPELKDPKVLFFFDYHRHVGAEITLITQHEKKISYKITTLAEIEIRAANTRINPFGSFLYKHVSGGEQFNTSRLKRDPAIFALYKSFQAGDGKAKKSNFRWVVLAFFLAVPVTLYFFFSTFASSFGARRKLLPQKFAKLTLGPQILGPSRAHPSFLVIRLFEIHLVKMPPTRLNLDKSQRIKAHKSSLIMNRAIHYPLWKLKMVSKPIQK